MITTYNTPLHEVNVCPQWRDTVLELKTWAISTLFYNESPGGIKFIEKHNSTKLSTQVQLRTNTSNISCQLLARYLAQVFNKKSSTFQTMLHVCMQLSLHYKSQLSYYSPKSPTSKKLQLLNGT